MNTSSRMTRTQIAVAVAFALMAGCATAPMSPEGSEAVRAKLTRLQADPQLASRATVAIQDAAVAVSAAEVVYQDLEHSKHLVFIADRKVDIAQASAQGRLYEDQRKALAEQAQAARLDSRTREADLAHRATDIAQRDAALARGETHDAHAANADLQRQIMELNAKATDRGLVVALGDVLFESGGSALRGGATSNLNKLSAFLNQYRDRTVIIEGHTDSQGSDAANQGLSQRRAEAVKAWLVSGGVDSGRLMAVGMGERSPVADNNTSTGRQMNRRVEVVIANAMGSTD